MERAGKPDIDDMCGVTFDHCMSNIGIAFDDDSTPNLYPGLEYKFGEIGVDPYILWNIGKDNNSIWEIRFYVDEDIEERFEVVRIEFWYSEYEEISYIDVQRGENYDLLMRCFNILQYGIICKP